MSLSKSCYLKLCRLVFYAAVSFFIYRALASFEGGYYTSLVSGFWIYFGLLLFSYLALRDRSIDGIEEAILARFKFVLSDPVGVVLYLSACAAIVAVTKLAISIGVTVLDRADMGQAIALVLGAVSFGGSLVARAFTNGLVVLSASILAIFAAPLFSIGLKIAGAHRAIDESYWLAAGSTWRGTKVAIVCAISFTLIQLILSSWNTLLLPSLEKVTPLPRTTLVGLLWPLTFVALCAIVSISASICCSRNTLAQTQIQPKPRFLKRLVGTGLSALLGIGAVVYILGLTPTSLVPRLSNDQPNRELANFIGNHVSSEGGAELAGESVQRLIQIGEADLALDALKSIENKSLARRISWLGTRSIMATNGNDVARRFANTLDDPISQKTIALLVAVKSGAATSVIQARAKELSDAFVSIASRSRRNYVLNAWAKDIGEALADVGAFKEMRTVVAYVSTSTRQGTDTVAAQIMKEYGAAGAWLIQLKNNAETLVAAQADRPDGVGYGLLPLLEEAAIAGEIVWVNELLRSIEEVQQSNHRNALAERVSKRGYTPIASQLYRLWWRVNKDAKALDFRTLTQAAQMVQEVDDRETSRLMLAAAIPLITDGRQLNRVFSLIPNGSFDDLFPALDRRANKLGVPINLAKLMPNWEFAKSVNIQLLQHAVKAIRLKSAQGVQAYSMGAAPVVASYAHTDHIEHVEHVEQLRTEFDLQEAKNVNLALAKAFAFLGNGEKTAYYLSFIPPDSSSLSSPQSPIHTLVGRIGYDEGKQWTIRNGFAFQDIYVFGALAQYAIDQSRFSDALDWIDKMNANRRWAWGLADTVAERAVAEGQDDIVRRALSFTSREALSYKSAAVYSEAIGDNEAALDYVLRGLDIVFEGEERPLRRQTYFELVRLLLRLHPQAATYHLVSITDL